MRQHVLHRHDTERDLLRRWERIALGPGEDRMSGSTPAAPPVGRAGATAIATPGSIPGGSTTPRPDDTPDPGTLICQHENRTHPLGGGMFVCFACWMKLLFGGRS